MRRRTLSTLILLAVGLATATPATAQVSKEVTLDDCIQMALEKNLDIRTTRLLPKRYRFNLNATTAAYDPNFQGSFDVGRANQPGGVDTEGRPYAGSSSSTVSGSVGFGGLLPTGLEYSLTGSVADEEYTTAGFPFSNARGFTGFRLTQPLLRNFWIDGTRLNIVLGRSALHRSRLTLQQQLIATITQVELGYLDLIAARETVKVQEKAVQLAEQLWVENKKRVAVGVMAPLDEKQAESQLAASRADLLSARNSMQLRQNALKRLLDDNFPAWMDTEIIPAERLAALPQTFSLQDSWSKGMILRPDLQQATSALEDQNVSLKYAKNQVFPQLDLVGSYGLTGNAFEVSGALDRLRQAGGDSYSVGVVFRVPITNQAARNRRRAAQVSVEEALLDLKQLEQQIMVEIHDAVSTARSSYERVDATRASVDYAQQALDAEQKKLANGKSTSFQVLQLQRDLTASESRNIDAVTQYNAALARLAQSEGSTLERHQVTFDFDE
ncbi:MAG: TolC family protein [Verrucomicrobiales bacterium]|nr:TolC family protein [Verrucomicrobiales bacterium]